MKNEKYTKLMEQNGKLFLKAQLFESEKEFVIICARGQMDKTVMKKNSFLYDRRIKGQVSSTL